MVEPDFSVPGLEHIFVIGDTSSARDHNGRPLPGLAPVAKQQGKYVGRVIAARVTGRPPPAPFRYRNFGNLATIGRSAAIADFGWFKLTGFAGWLMWSMVHIFYLIGFRTRLVVAIDWLWAYLTFERGARLITNCEPALEHDVVEQPHPLGSTGTDNRG
jgi:NADH dehydrogenase